MKKLLLILLLAFGMNAVAQKMIPIPQDKIDKYNMELDSIAKNQCLDGMVFQKPDYCFSDTTKWKPIITMTDTSAPFKNTELMATSTIKTYDWQPTTINFYGIFEQNLRTGEIKFDSLFIKQFIEQSVFKYLLEYKKECYNDSTYVDYWQPNSSPTSYDKETGLAVTLAIYISPTHIQKWIHKDPTFSDFLNWIEKK